MRLIRLFILCNVFAFNSSAQLNIATALCENKINPNGISLINIHFGWELTSDTNEQYQTAYQIVISSSITKLQSGNYNVWNSAVVKSDQSVLISYKGKTLLAAKTYFWLVRVWDKNNKRSAWSNIQNFTTGLISKKDWNNAKWIGYENMDQIMRVAPGIHAPDADSLRNKCMQRPVIPLFRKNFIVDKKIAGALIFISGLGQYEMSINGIKPGKGFLTPGWTYYDKSCFYNTYNVTDLLSNGHNAIGIVAGNGFYNINRERYFKIVTAFGFPKLICCLKIIYEDGSVKKIVSDATWQTAPSPITFTSIYGGEDVDAQLEQPGWNTSTFNAASWKNVLLVTPPKGKLVAENDYPVSIEDSFGVKKITHPIPGAYLYDFGQNISGIIRLIVQGKKGQTIKLIPAELLNQQQLANQSASGEPYYFTYTLKGDHEEIWQPTFSYYGFRYVQVEGAVPETAITTSLPKVIELTSLHTRNSATSNGSFSCSDELFNRIYAVINWAIKSNMQSVITDCPHREKLSWLEQDYLMGASIHYNFDIYNLYRKLVFDLMDAQKTNGLVPDIAPEYAVFKDGFLDSPEWGSSSVILPWLLYTWYGDKDILQQAYPMMKKYIAYLEKKSTTHILSYGLGDWFDYGPNQPGEAQLTPKAVTATSIYYYDVALLSKIADILNKKNEALRYRQLAAIIKSTFNKKFFNDTTKIYSTGSQTSMAMPLCVGLVNEKNRETVLNNLIDSINAGNKALTAGDIGFHFLIKALDDGGKSQMIFDMNNRDDVPGYGFQLKKGATSLTESWAALENVSNNHLMMGHIMEWFYSGLAGIGQEDSSVAFKKIRIRPQPVGDILWAKGNFHSPYGWITSEWTREKNTFQLHVHIPVNTSAIIYLPASISSKIYVNKILAGDKDVNRKNSVALIQIGSGEYWFDVK
ncbi:MAG: family 78 glycoside hydrolase catalytic domain [Ginsengibacter sp.]